MNLRDQFNLERLWRRGPVVSVLRLEGVIMPRQRRGGLSLASHAGAIEKAFRASGLVAVAIVVNSPGGSPVQSALLYRRIRQLADEKHVPVIAFAEDVAASGGYWLALAGDEIFTEETSLIGSIGVISAGFGFYQLLGRLGIERRLHTAGERKSLLDPFLPEDPSDVARLTELQQDIHRSFKDHVRRRRAGLILSRFAMTLEDDLRAAIRTIPDHPKPGILFRDITTLLGNARAFRRAVDELVHPFAGTKIDKVAGIEARGFILGGAIAHQLSTGFVPIRKKGKLPHAKVSIGYSLEYGIDEMEMHADAVTPGERVVLIDDLVATGGTAEAAVKLLKQLGAELVVACFVIDLPDLGGRKKIEALGVPVRTLIAFAGH